MQRETTDQRRERINKIAAETIKELSEEKFAFSVKEAERRIMAAGALEAVSKEEAAKAIEAAGAVNLGRLEHDGKKSRDVFLTTEENLNIEKEIIDEMKSGKGAIQSKLMTCEEVRAEIDRIEEVARAEGRHNADFNANAEQRAAVEHVLCSEDRIVGIDGLAGTGKTTGAMTRLKWIADERGIEVKGVCFTGQAALGLQTDTGIKSDTIHHVLGQLERESGVIVEKPQPDEVRQKWDFSQVRKIPEGHREIWIVDEAGLVSDHLMLQLEHAARLRGVQIVLMGDPLQLPPVGAGSPMRDMEAAGMATAHLNDIQRQKNEELLQAVRESVRIDKEGKAHLKTLEALEHLKIKDKDGKEREVNNYREVKDAKERRAEIVKEMTQGPLDQYDNNLLLVSTNADRKAYNAAIRAEYIERGELEKGEKFKIEVQQPSGKTVEESRNFAKGDRLIFLQNETKEMNVKNGTIGEVDYVNGKYIGVTVQRETESGGKYYDLVEIDTEKYKKFDHAYALTEYKAQGKTVPKVVCDMNTKGGMKTRNQLYVDISRAKFEAVVYTDDKKKLEKQTAKFAEKVTSRDFSKRIARMKTEQGIKNNDRYHSPKETQEQKLKKSIEQIEKHTLRYAERGMSEKQREAAQKEREQGRDAKPMTEKEAEVKKVNEIALRYVESEKERAAEERRREREKPQPEQETKRKEERRQEQKQEQQREPAKAKQPDVFEKIHAERSRTANAKMDAIEINKAAEEAARKKAEREAALKAAKAVAEAGKKQGLTHDAPTVPGGERVRALTPPGGNDAPPMPGGR